MKEIMVQLENANYIYRDSHEDNQDVIALKNISLIIPKGQFVAILGPNGSGKSTLARLLNALLLPTKGCVYISGFDTSDESNVWDIRTRLGMVFQNPDNQIIATSVEEDVAFGPENLGIDPLEIRIRVDEALEMVEMKNYHNHAPHLLSGGQKQRIAIAGILAMKPKCIVLDEATAMLDPSGRKEVMDILKKLHLNEGITIIHITHHMDEAVQADRVIVMDEGKVIMDDTPKKVFSQVDKMKEAALDVPQVTELIHSLKKYGFATSHEIIHIDEALNLLVNLIKCDRGRFSVTHKERNRESSPVTVSPVIQVRDLSHIYMQGTSYQKVALDNINLNIYKGEFIGIIGHTGSGKSTLVQHFNGILKPFKGDVTINGLSISGKNLKKLRKSVGLVFQYPEHQLFEETVYKDIAFGLMRMGLNEEEILSRVNYAMDIVNLDRSLYEKSPFELSGGQKRRVAIAGVLVMMPEILILDEPTAGLDPQGSNEIYSFLKLLNDEYKTTIIVISHSMEDIAKYSDRVIVMNQGRVQMDDDTRSVFKRSRELKEFGLDVPQVTQLFERIHRQVPKIRNDVLTVEEGVELLSYDR